MKVIAVVAIGPNNELGLDGDLVYRSKEDLQHFKKLTMDKIVVVGRKTYESMPPLKGRTVICLTSNPDTVSPKQVGDIIISTTSKDPTGWHRIAAEARSKGTDVVIAGGAEIYSLYSRMVQELYITQFSEPREADTYFPRDQYKHLQNWNTYTQFSTGESVFRFD